MADTPSPWIADVTTADFEREVLQASYRQPVVVDFWSVNCRPCLMLGPLLERLIEERQGGVRLAKVNVDQEQDLAYQFGITAIPAVKAFRNGRLVREFEGLLPEAYLRSFLDEISPSQADKLIDQARALEAEKPAEAERLYRQALGQQSNLDEARVGLARALLAQDQTEEIDEILEPVGSEGELGAEAARLGAQAYFRRVSRGFADESTLRQRLSANPKDAGARFELGCVLAAKGEYPEALEMLLSAGERDPKLAAGKVRETMVKVFYALGATHPLANEYRGKLSQLLY
jgi:putative thioredoxin